MPLYNNGQIPLNHLVQFDTGNGAHVGTVGIRDRWYALRQNVKDRYGKTLQITSGWNVYRPFSEQVKGRENACRQGNCNGAAVAGSSSHGGTWRSRRWTSDRNVDALAIDVGNYGIIGRDAFYEEARKVGFLAGAITKDIAGMDEPWHIIDLDPYRVASPVSTTKEKEMILLRRESNNAAYVVIPGEYIKHVPNANEERLLGYVTGESFKGLNDGDLSVIMWALGFPDLQGNTNRLPLNGQFFWAPGR